jgi:hypothetical protein
MALLSLRTAVASPSSANDQAWIPQTDFVSARADVWGARIFIPKELLEC